MEPTIHALRCAVQALAATSEFQLHRYPSFAVAADELALDFDNWLGAARHRFGAQWTRGQYEALAQLHEQLSSMSGPANAERWSAAALRNEAEWVRVRELARAVLAEFGWPEEEPPPCEDAFIRGSRA